MVTDPSSPTEGEQFETFIIRRGDVYYVTAEVETFRPGHPDHANVVSLFKQGYEADPLEAAPVRKRSSTLAAESVEGVITMDVNLSER